MFILRCTSKLLQRLRVPINESEAIAHTTTRLGDWLADVVMFGRKPVVLAISQRTLLPVMLPLAPTTTVLARLPAAVAEVLSGIGVTGEAIAFELAQMKVCAVEPATHADRVTLGSLNDFGRLFERSLQVTLSEAAMELSRAACGPLEMKAPRDVTRVVMAME